jgi:hypothetical protein
MLHSFFSFIKRLYYLVVAIILSLLMGFAVYGSWSLYLEEKLANEFIKEGHLVRVKVEDTSTEPESWKDYLSNSVYLSFSYQHQVYEARFVSDTIYVSTGDSVSLFYHPGLKAFMQIQQPFHFNQSKGSSRLIKWSVINSFSQENKWLAICLVLAAAFLLFSGGVLVTITGWGFLQVIGRFIGSMLLVGGALFFSYDSWHYYRYYQHIKTNSEQTKVTILDTDRSSYYSRQSRYWKSYLYTAKVAFEGQQRIIPLQERDYDRLTAGDQLEVLYDVSLEELIPLDYPIDYRQFYLVLFFWSVSFLIIYHQLIRPKKTTKLSISHT